MNHKISSSLTFTLCKRKRTCLLSLLRNASALFVCLFVFVQHGTAQQTPILSQYMFNPFLINPAIAGTNNYYQVRTSHRLQWLGFKDGPITNTVSAYGPHPNKKYNMGFGGTLFSDITGPLSHTDFSGSYAYNISLNKEIHLSMGTRLSIAQVKYDKNAIRGDESDPVLETSTLSSILPDAAIGAYLYSTRFNVGLSATQLFNNRQRNEADKVYNRLRTTFYLTGGYTYFINREFKIEPNTIIKYVYPTMPQVDLNCRVIYQNTFWGGLSFRTQDALTLLFGYIYDKKIYIGYACDIVVTDIGKYGRTSQELMISYRFNDIK